MCNDVPLSEAPYTEFSRPVADRQASLTVLSEEVKALFSEVQSLLSMHLHIKALLLIWQPKATLALVNALVLDLTELPNLKEPMKLRTELHSLQLLLARLLRALFNALLSILLRPLRVPSPLSSLLPFEEDRSQKELAPVLLTVPSVHEVLLMTSVTISTIRTITFVVSTTTLVTVKFPFPLFRPPTRPRFMTSRTRLRSEIRNE